MPVSLREVADRAGVARGTVSSVLNNRGAAVRISSRTEEHVRRVAAEMGYRPNRFAQGLKGRTNCIGLMIAGLQNPFFLEILEAAEERAFRVGYDVMPDSAFQLRASCSALGKLSGWPVDGILIWADPTSSLSDYLGSHQDDLPVVYLGYRRTDNSDFVGIDRGVGAQQLMQHLGDKGYKRVAYLCPGQGLGVKDPRYIAYLELCQKNGQEPNWIHMEPRDRVSIVTQAWMRQAGWETGQQMAARPASERPDAVVCLNDLVAIGLYNGLRKGGLRVPEDIAVAGFDGIDEGQYLDRTLTTVVSPGVPMVETALDILTQRLAAKDDKETQETPPPQQVMLPSRLRVGATT